MARDNKLEGMGHKTPALRLCLAVCGQCPKADTVGAQSMSRPGWLVVHNHMNPNIESVTMAVPALALSALPLVKELNIALRRLMPQRAWTRLAFMSDVRMRICTETLKRTRSVLLQVTWKDKRTTKKTLIFQMWFLPFRG
eukprot:4200755-Amphidinium_carterae.1